MSKENGQATPSRHELEAEIEQAREHLAETVDALTGKLDVKGRAKDKAGDVKDAAAHKVQEPDTQRLVTLAVCGLVAALGVAIFRSGR